MIEVIELLSYVGLVTIWVSLPLLPSVLIYRLFPETSVAVSGPLAGLTVRAGGAFGAYLVIFAAIYVGVVPKVSESIRRFEHPEVWTVKGKIALVDQNGKPYTYEKLLEKARTRPDQEARPGSDYKFSFAMPEEKNGEFATWVIEIPEFGVGMINIQDLEKENKVRYHRMSRIIEILEPIVVKGKAPRVAEELPQVKSREIFSQIKTDIAAESLRNDEQRENSRIEQRDLTERARAGVVP